MRRLFAREAFPSMFVYCTGALHLSEAEAYLRITVARAARKHGVLLEMLRDGRLHLRGIAMLAPLLTEENRDSLLRRASHLSKREMEGLVAELSPRPDVVSGIRTVPERRDVRSADSAQTEIGRSSQDELCPDRVDASGIETGSGALAVPRLRTPADHCTPPARSDTEALSPGRYRVQFTASAEFRDKLERLEARRLAKTAAPRKTLRDTNTSQVSRHIPAAVRRAVVQRDGCRCRFVDVQGRRCSERHRLEFHHRHPYAMGGDHSPCNISLLCAAHNRLMAEHDYGRTAILSSLPSAEVHRHAPGTT